MKTHELANALVTLAQVLKSVPNQELENLKLPVHGIARRSNNSTSIPVALSTLVALSSYGKREWSEIIRAYNLPVEVKATESARDIIGKILRALEKDEDARKRLTNDAQRRPDVSPELMNVLSALLKT